MKLEAKKGDTILLVGPALIYLSKGRASVFEADLYKNKIITVKKEKQIAIKSHEDSYFFLNIGSGSSYKIIYGDTLPFSWIQVIKDIIKHGQKKILIVGGADVGKSTFSVLLSNSILKSGIQSVLIDADIGQSDLGPPTTLGLGLVRNYIEDLAFTETISLYFIGQITPSHDFEKVINGIKKLIERASTLNLSSFTIINTDGWIKDMGAKVYKKRLIEEISPDLTVCIGDKNDFIGLFGKNKNFVLLDPSIYVKKRSKEERRKIREYGYRNYLNDAKLKQLDLNKVGLKGSIDNLKDRNRLVGLVDRDGFLLGIGILKGFNKKDGRIKIFTPVERFDELQKIELGHIKISESGREF